MNIQPSSSGHICHCCCTVPIRQGYSLLAAKNARAISLAIGYSFRHPILWTIYPDLLES